MKISRRYQPLPDRAVCMYRGCPWHVDGQAAESLGEIHIDKTGHPVEVTTGAKLLLSLQHSAAVSR